MWRPIRREVWFLSYTWRVDEVLEKHTTSLPSPTSPIYEITSSSSSLEGKKKKKKIEKSLRFV